MTTNEQLELGINGIPAPSRAARHSDRATRAAWWFAQMHRIVADAIDYQTAGQTRTQQNWVNSPQSK